MGSDVLRFRRLAFHESSGTHESRGSYEFPEKTRHAAQQPWPAYRGKIDKQFPDYRKVLEKHFELVHGPIPLWKKMRGRWPENCLGLVTWFG
jgi:hypothetical protein